MGFSPELAARARQLPEVAAVAEFRRGRWRTGGEDRFLTAAEPADLAAVVDLDVQAGRLADLEDGGLLVHEDEAEQQGLKVGDEVLMEFAARPGRVPVRVDGTFATNELTGDYVLSLRDFEANFADQLDSSAMVKLAPGVAPAAARPALDRVVDDFPSAELSDQEEFKEEVAGQVTEVLNLFYALLGLAILIALMGIVNTLALSVFERTRELGLLRAVGTSRRQVRSMVRTEGAIIAVLGAVLGLGVGLIVALAMLAALRDQGITETAVPAGRLAAFVVMAAAAGLVAAVLPARRAARLDILAAIAHE